VDDAKCGRLVAEREHGEFEQRLKGATLLTAEVLYYMPKHPTLLQTFMWQTLDEAPKFPRLEKFLDFWRREIDAVIHCRPRPGARSTASFSGTERLT
jgi:uncharacterized protein Usg